MKNYGGRADVEDEKVAHEVLRVDSSCQEEEGNEAKPPVASAWRAVAGNDEATMN
jgi:hypothetical protein